MAKPYKDLGKDSKDLLSQDFPSGNGVTITSQFNTPNDINVKSSLKRTFKKDVEKGPKEFVEVTVEPKYEWKNQNIEFNTKFSTSRNYSAGITLKDLVVKGSKFEFNSTLSGKGGLVIKSSDSFKNDSVYVQGSIAYPIQEKFKTPINFAGELVAHFPKNLLWGFSIALEKDKKSSKIVSETTVGYSLKEWQLFGRFSRNFKNEETYLGGSFFHKLNDKCAWGLDFDTEANKDGAQRGPIAQVGGEYKSDGTVFKARSLFKWVGTGYENPELRLALSAKKKISKHFSATIGADLNVRQFLGDPVGDVHSLGFEFKIEQ